MSAGGARRGRRDNGLDATEYAIVGDVDPRVGEHLLDVLAAAGIAAYLQPSADLNPVTRTTTIPPRPTDRLYADRTQLDTARGYLAQLTEDETTAPPTDATSDPDIDAAWAQIVAGYHVEVDTTAPPWPAAENLGPHIARPAPTGPDAVRQGGDGTANDIGAALGVAPDGTAPATPDGTGPATPDGTGPATPDGTGPATPDGTSPATPGARRLPSAADISGISIGRRAEKPSLLDGLDSFGADLPDDPDEGYTPPPPPPLPHISKYAIVGVLAIVVGFALFIFPGMMPIDRSLATMIGFVGILAGFVTLISRLRPGDEEDDDPDDGAVV